MLFHSENNKETHLNPKLIHKIVLTLIIGQNMLVRKVHLLWNFAQTVKFCLFSQRGYAPFQISHINGEQHILNYLCSSPGNKIQKTKLN